MEQDSVPPSALLPRIEPRRSRFSLRAPEGRANAAAAGFTAAAAAVAAQIDEPIAKAAVLVACAVLTWLVGLYQPRPL